MNSEIRQEVIQKDIQTYFEKFGKELPSKEYFKTVIHAAKQSGKYQEKVDERFTFTIEYTETEGFVLKQDKVFTSTIADISRYYVGGDVKEIRWILPASETVPVEIVLYRYSSAYPDWPSPFAFRETIPDEVEQQKWNERVLQKLLEGENKLQFNGNVNGSDISECSRVGDSVLIHKKSCETYAYTAPDHDEPLLFLHLVRSYLQTDC